MSLQIEQPLTVIARHAGALARVPEVRVALALTGIVCLLTFNFGIFSGIRPDYQHLGGEYYNIASALAAGRGFSDAFGVESGPTAWMPPLYPALQAGLLVLLGRKELVADVVVALSILSLVTVGVLVFNVARHKGTTLRARHAVQIYVIWLWAFYDSFFMMTHDVWLLTLLVGWAVWLLFRSSEVGGVNHWYWGAVGAFASLLSPALTFAWLATTGYLFTRYRQQRRGLLIAACMTVCAALPWTIRNAAVFGQFIPTKSNLYYDAYRANYADDDGIYDGNFSGHLYTTPSARPEYARLGERAYLAQYRERFFAALRKDPMRFAGHVINRALAVTVHHVPSKTIPRSGFMNALAQCIFALPILGALVWFWAQRKQWRWVVIPLIFYAAFLLPYVLVAFYMRYLMPLTPLLVLFIFLGVDSIAAQRTRGAHADVTD